VARGLSTALGVPHLEMDHFRARILPLSDQGVGDRDIAYNAMHLAAELLIPWCHTVILDATYTAASCRNALVDVIARTGSALFLIECHIDAAAAIDRYARRDSHPAVDLTPQRVRSLVADYPFSKIAYDTRSDSGALDLAAITEYVKSGPPLDEAGLFAWSRRGRPREQPSLSISSPTS
jgi:predicted kinase